MRKALPDSLGKEGQAIVLAAAKQAAHRLCPVCRKGEGFIRTGQSGDSLKVTLECPACHKRWPKARALVCTRTKSI